jgi:hypothetical protein
MDGSLTSGFVPQTPPSRPLVKNYHRRLDSFPTDDIHEDPEFGIDDESLTTGITASISLGAFPVFLIQESPTREGAGKPGTWLLVSQTTKAQYSYTQVHNFQKAPSRPMDFSHLQDGQRLDWSIKSTIPHLARRNFAMVLTGIAKIKHNKLPLEPLFA